MLSNAMGHTFSDNLFHVIFSTANRVPFNEERMDRACEYMGGVARKYGFHAIAIGSTRDHVHLLLRLPPQTSVSNAVQLLKGSSSKWYHDTFTEAHFAWQEGFSVFSVSRSIAPKVEAYVRGQKEHHLKRDYEEELRAFLRKHGLVLQEDGTVLSESELNLKC